MHFLRECSSAPHSGCCTSLSPDHQSNDDMEDYDCDGVGEGVDHDNVSAGLHDKGDECTQEENSVGESSHEDSDNESDIGSDSGSHDTVCTLAAPITATTSARKRQRRRQ